MKSKWLTITLLGTAISAGPVFAAAAPQPSYNGGPTEPAHPGTVNYVEGAAFLDGKPLVNKDVGNTTLDEGQQLSTGNGKAELLLTPGVFLRVDDNSTIKMISPGLALTQVDLEKGRAGVEVDEIHDQNDLQIIDSGVTTRLDKKGYYEFNATPDQAAAMVYKGMAKSEVADGKWREIKSGHELALNGGANGQPIAKEKPADFDTHAPDQLYNWSSLRSEYLAEANNEIAGGYPGAAPGWYWDPYMWDYTFLGPGFYSPFGWGFYPMGWGGWYGGLGWYGRGWYGRGPYGHGPYRYGGYNHGVAHGGVYGGGFHGGGMGGGFHGGGGGGGGRR